MTAELKEYMACVGSIKVLKPESCCLGDDAGEAAAKAIYRGAQSLNDTIGGKCVHNGFFCKLKATDGVESQCKLLKAYEKHPRPDPDKPQTFTIFCAAQRFIKK